MKCENYIPDLYRNSIFDVDYDKLYAENYRIILIDLDNTLMSYQDTIPNQKTIDFIFSLKEKWQIIIVSNNRKKRVEKAARKLGLEYVYYAKKPFLFGMKKALKKTNYAINQVINVGDQLTTDIKAGKKLKFYSILVDAVSKKKEMLYTRIGRFYEKRILKKLKKKCYDKYKILEEYDRRNYGK